MRTQLLRTVLRRVATAPDSDAVLLRRFGVERDETAFTELVHRYARLVWGVCRNMLANESDAEDAFQATFLALVRSADRINDTAALGGWLHGVAYRVCQKSRRTRARRDRRERIAARQETAAPVADSSWETLLAAVHEEVCRLPNTQRMAFVLCCLEGKGVTDAAAQLGWKLGTLSGRLTRAKQAVLDRLARRGIAPGIAVVATAAGGRTATSAAPTGLIERVLDMTRPDGAVAESILHLAKGVSDMGLTRTKLLAAGVVLAATIGITFWSSQVPTADAQAAQSRVTQPAASAGSRAGGISALPPGTQWEYKYVQFGDEGYEKKANDLGRDGWEMVTSVGGSNFFFKRPKSGRLGYTTPAPASPPAPGTVDSGSNSYRSILAGSSDATTTDANAVNELIPLKNASASQMTATLQTLFSNRVTMVADPRSNTLIVKGTPALIKELKKLVEELDALPEKGDPKGPRR